MRHHNQQRMAVPFSRAWRHRLVDEAAANNMTAPQFVMMLVSMGYEVYKDNYRKDYHNGQDQDQPAA